jgi:hypothetical protein
VHEVSISFSTRNVHTSAPIDRGYYTRIVPRQALKPLLNISYYLSTVASSANLRNWAIIFYNLSKHFPLSVAILPGKDVSISASEAGFR